MSINAKRWLAPILLLILQCSGETVKAESLAPNPLGHAELYSDSGCVNDATIETSNDELRKLIPEIFEDPTLLYHHEDGPSRVTIARLNGECNADVNGVLSQTYLEAVWSYQRQHPQEVSVPPVSGQLKALIGYNESIVKPGMMTHVRFVEVPSENNTYYGLPYSYGLSSLDRFWSHGELTGVFLGSRGNIELKGINDSSWYAFKAPTLEEHSSYPSAHGEIVDFFIEEDKLTGVIDVYVAVNGETSGDAIKILPSESSAEKLGDLHHLMPAISATKGQTMTVAVVSWKPEPVFQRAVYKTRKDDFRPGALSGTWIIPEDQGPLHKLTLELTEKPSSPGSVLHRVDVAAHVGNYLTGKIFIDQYGRVSLHSGYFSTQRGLQGLTKEMYYKLVDLLECVDRVTLYRHQHLLLQCKNGLRQVFVKIRTGKTDQ